jgi:hypothetical protein
MLLMLLLVPAARGDEPAEPPPPPALPLPLPPEPGIYHGIRQGLKINAPPDLTREQIAAHNAELERAARDPSFVARLIEWSGVNPEVEISGSIPFLPGSTIGLSTSVDAKGNVGATSIEVDSSLIGISVELDAEKRTIELTVSTGELERGNSSVKGGVVAELHYRTTRDFFGALTFDGEFIPGQHATRTVIEALRRGVAEHKPAVGAPADVSVLRASFEGAARQVQAMFPSGDALSRFDSIALGTTIETSQEIAGRTVVAAYTEKSRQFRDQPGRVEQEVETEVKVGVEGAIRGFEGSLYAVVSDEPTAEGLKADAKAIADRVKQLGVDAMQSDLLREIGQVADPAVVAGLKALEQVPGVYVPGSDTIVATTDPQVGGVHLHYDPNALEARSPEQSSRMLAELGAATAGRKQGFVIRSGGRQRLAVVSLRDALASGRLGLARIRGYVLAGDDLLLLGDADPALPPIPLDVAAALARAIWKQGQFPYVSLDPDPADFAGPQKARIGNLPAELEDSRLTQVLLDADYEMKRIMLGESVLDIPGFRSFVDLIQRGGGFGRSGETMTRNWLYPVQSGVGEVVVTDGDAGRQAVLFDSRVQVLSERLKRVGDYLEGTGDLDPLEEEAARQFTLHYDAIAAHRPVFRDLAAVFDVAKLCAVLRARKVQHSLLDRLAARPVARVEVARSYRGIGPKLIAGTTVVVSGGAIARQRVPEAAFVSASAAAPALAAAPGATIDLDLPSTVDIDAARARDVDAELAFTRGVERWSALDYAGALTQLDRALTDDPELIEARVYRSLVRFGLGQLAEARADIDVATAAAPCLLGFRALLETYTGELDAALADAERAESACPQEDAVLLWTATVRMHALRLEEAEATVQRLLQRAPLDRDAYTLLTMLDVLYRLGPERARARVAAMIAVPVPVMEAMARGTELHRQFDFAGAEREFARCAELAGAQPPAAGSPAAGFHARERCMVGRAIAVEGFGRMFAKVDPQRAQAATAAARQRWQELVDLHPDWPTPKLFMVRSGAGGEAVRTFEEALKAGALRDPLLDELELTVGSDQPEVVVGLAVWYGLEDKGSREAIHVLELITPRMRGPEKEMWETMLVADSMRPAKALAALRDSVADLPDTLPGDPILLWSYGYTAGIIRVMHDQFGSPEQAYADAVRFLERTGRVQLSNWEALTQLAAFRMQIVASLGELWDKQLREHPETARGNPDAARAALVARAAESSRYLAAEAEFSLANAQRKLDEERGAAPAEDPAARMRRQQAAWVALVDAAETVIELRTISLLVEVIVTGAQAAIDQGHPDAREMLVALDPVRARLQRVRLPPPAHDWKRWGAPHTAGRGFPWLPVMLGAGGALALGAVFVVIRRRRAAGA